MYAGMYNMELETAMMASLTALLNRQSDCMNNILIRGGLWQDFAFDITLIPATEPEI